MAARARRPPHSPPPRESGRSSRAAFNAFHPGLNSTHYQARLQTFWEGPAPPPPSDTTTAAPARKSTGGLSLPPGEGVALLLPGSLTPATPGQLDPCTCNPSHLLRIGRPKAKLIPCLIPNLPSLPHFHPLSRVKTFRDSWIKISGTVQHPSQPGGTPHQHHSPSPGPLPSQAGVLGQLPWVLDSRTPPRSCQTNVFN